MRLTGCLPQPVSQIHETAERRIITPDQRGGFNKIAAVGHKIPISGKSSQSLQGLEINELGGEHLIRSMRTVDHLPSLVVPDDRRASEALQNANLDLLWFQR